MVRKIEAATDKSQNHKPETRRQRRIKNLRERRKEGKGLKFKILNSIFFLPLSSVPSDFLSSVASVFQVCSFHVQTYPDSPAARCSDTFALCSQSVLIWVEPTCAWPPSIPTEPCWTACTPALCRIGKWWSGRCVPRSARLLFG